MDDLSDSPLVSVIMIFLNAEKFIQEAIQSVFFQNYPRWELLLVDDGSTDGSTRIARTAAEENPKKVHYLEHPNHQNRGMSASRNLGASQASGEYLAFLDADDVWRPEALDSAVKLLEANPVAGMLYGRTEWWYSWTGRAEDQGRDFRDSVAQKFRRPNSLAYPPELLRLFWTDGSAVPCLCSLLVRKRVFDEVGGFEESFHTLFEDQAFYTKICLRSIVYVTDACWSRYRRHIDSCCSRAERDGWLEQARQEFHLWRDGYLASQGVKRQDLFSLNVAINQKVQDPILEERSAWIAQLESGKAWLEEQWLAWKKIAEERERMIQELKDWIAQLEAGKSWLEKDRDYWRQVAEVRDKGIPGLVWWATKRWRDHTDVSVNEGSGKPGRLEGLTRDGLSIEVDKVVLNRADQGFPSPVLPPTEENSTWVPGRWPRRPVSREWGYDRGTPVDRYYIEKFLEKYAADIKGCVLEIGDNSYTLRYGGDRVVKSDVLHVTEGNPQATVVADLAGADHIASNQFDCIILTQTLHLIFDLRPALQTLYRILKPGGVLLATFPGITRISSTEWPGSWYWGLTNHSARQLFEEIFQPSSVFVGAFGNVLAASAFLYGFAAEELNQEDLEYRDPEYDLLVTVCAVKETTRSREAAEKKPVQIAHHRKSSPEAQALILLYHCVAPPVSDPWMLCVSPEHFEEQLQAINEFGSVLRLEDLVDRLSAGRLPPHAVALTFDDGYAATMRYAYPLLDKYAMPATVFIPTGAIGQSREFWWDELERVFLLPGRLPPVLELEINHQIYRWDLEDSALYSLEAFERQSSWRAWQTPTGPRQRIYADLWELLYPLDRRIIEDLLDRILKWAGLPSDARLTHAILTWSEVLNLAKDRWIEFGSHGVTHTPLASLPFDAQANELRQSKIALEKMLESQVNILAYPYGKAGHYSTQTMTLARQAGYKLALVNIPGIVNQQTDLFQLPRLFMEDWSGEELARQLSRWMEE